MTNGNQQFTLAAALMLFSGLALAQATESLSEPIGVIGGNADAAPINMNYAVPELKITPPASAEQAIGYQQWYLDRMFIIAPAGAYVGKWLQSFREFPPRMKPGSFNLDNVMEAVSNPQKN